MVTRRYGQAIYQFQTLAHLLAGTRELGAHSASAFACGPAFALPAPVLRHPSFHVSQIGGMCSVVGVYVACAAHDDPMGFSSDSTKLDEYCVLLQEASNYQNMPGVHLSVLAARVNLLLRWCRSRR